MVLWLMKWDEIIICFKINRCMYTSYTDTWLGPPHPISFFSCYLREPDVEVAQAGI